MSFPLLPNCWGSRTFLERAQKDKYYGRILAPNSVSEEEDVTQDREESLQTVVKNIHLKSQQGRLIHREKIISSCLIQSGRKGSLCLHCSLCLRNREINERIKHKEINFRDACAWTCLLLNFPVVSNIQHCPHMVLASSFVSRERQLIELSHNPGHL